MTLSPIARAVAIALLSACVLCAVMWARALLEAHAEQGRAQAALVRRDEAQAIMFYRRAARWNAPGNVYASDALAALAKLAASLEARGELEQALAAQRAIHAAIHASSGFVTLERDRLLQADQRIATLIAQKPPPEIDAGR